MKEDRTTRPLRFEPHMRRRRTLPRIASAKARPTACKQRGTRNPSNFWTWTERIAGLAVWRHRGRITICDAHPARTEARERLLAGRQGGRAGRDNRQTLADAQRIGPQ